MRHERVRIASRGGLRQAAPSGLGKETLMTEVVPEACAVAAAAATLMTPTRRRRRESVLPADAGEPVAVAAHKLKAATLLSPLIRRALNPRRLWEAARLQARRRADRRSFDDAHLALYSQILPSDFLHFGYFDDP